LKISIVIPNFNGAALLSDCFNSIIESAKICPNLSLEIILVDNASTDNSFDIFNKFKKDESKNLKLKIIFLKENNGFAGAVNQGIKKSTYPYIFVLNNDIKLEKNWFKTMTQTIKNNPDYSVFYGLVLNKTGELIESEGLKYYLCGRCENINNGQPYKNNRPVKGDVRRTEGFSAIWGAPASAIIYTKKALTQVGNFDSRFFAYIEDVDLAYRLDKFKYKTLYIPRSLSYHLGGATSSKMGNLRQKMSYRNWHYLIIKNYSLQKLILNFPSLFIERLKNLKYFYQHTPKASFPFEFFQVHFQICRFFFTNLLESTK